MLRRVTEAIVKGGWICRRREDKKQAGVPEGGQVGIYEGWRGEKLWGRRSSGKVSQAKTRRDEIIGRKKAQTV